MTIVGFEGSIVLNAAGILPVVVELGERLEVVRCGAQRVERTPLEKSEFERLVERGLLHRLPHQMETDISAPVLMYLPDRALFGPRWHREHFFLEAVMHSPGVHPAFHEHSNAAVITSHTRAHDILRLVLEELLGSLRLGPARWGMRDDHEARLFLRSASAILKDENVRERVFAVLFAQASSDEAKWNALVRDARREFSEEALDRIKLDAEALRPGPLSVRAG